MGRIVALDYGTKRVGIATTDPLQIIASPLDTKDPEETLVWLKDFLAKEAVDRLVVGLAVQDNGEPSSNYAPTQAYIKRIRKLHPELLVETHDERFTSKMAKSALLASGINKKKRRDKALVDKVSASLILQSYLESKDL